MKILVSKCLLGCNCRYDGKSCKNDKVLEFCKDKEVFSVCPEQSGGLSTPRDPAERINDKVISSKGKDVTDEYIKGANYALSIAKENNINIAILKSKSPSCGKGIIYDGTFSGNKIKGNGVTTELFLNNNITVLTEDEI